MFAVVKEQILSRMGRQRFFKAAEASPWKDSLMGWYREGILVNTVSCQAQDMGHGS